MLETPNVDVLTDTLRQLRLRIGLLGRGDYCGNWALDFAELRKAAFHLIGHGSFWLHCDTHTEPLEVREGDVVFFPQPQWHQFSATPTRCNGTNIVTPDQADGPIRTLVCFTVEFESRAFNPVLSSLPAVLVIRCAEDPTAANLVALTRLVLSEYDGSTPAGYEVMRERLAEALLIQILRHHMRSCTELQGLLRTLADPQLARALAALHAEPGRDWDVDALAAIASMSRSAFARRFGECMGTSPMHYLGEWRMQLAEQLLRDRSRSVAQIAETLGYKTEAAFRHAFKRSRGIGPGEVRRAARTSAPRPGSAKDGA